jgi:CheY-like chemotaxis protein
MDGTERAIWFLGDLDDPWVAAILASVSSAFDILPLPCTGDVPQRPFDALQPPRVVVLHRARLSPADVVRLEGWRADPRPTALPRIILCFSSYVRYVELERCSRNVDVLMGEATAAETLARHLARFLPDRPPSPWPLPAIALPVDVASTNHGLRSVLAEALTEAGFRVTHGRDPRCERPRADSDSEPVITVWDVPVLEARWPDLIRRQSRQGPMIALLGFADRPTVEQARTAGASACLDMPVELDDLAHVVLRLAREDRRRIVDAGRIEPAHALPPAPISRASRGVAAIRNRGESSKPAPSAVLVSATNPHPAYGHPLPQGEGISSPSPSGRRCPEGG